MLIFAVLLCSRLSFVFFARISYPFRPGHPWPSCQRDVAVVVDFITDRYSDSADRVVVRLGRWKGVSLCKRLPN